MSAEGEGLGQWSISFLEGLVHRLTTACCVHRWTSRRWPEQLQHLFMEHGPADGSDHLCLHCASAGWPASTPPEGLHIPMWKCVCLGGGAYLAP